MTERSRLPLAVLDRAIIRARKYSEDVAELYGFELLEEFQSELVLRAYTAWRTFDPAPGGQLWKHWLRDQFRYGIRDVLRAHTGERQKHKAAFLAAFSQVSIQGGYHVKAESINGRGDAHVGRGLHGDYAFLPLDETLAADPDWDAIPRRLAKTEWVIGILKLLHARERFIVEEHYFNGVPKKDVAQALGISPTRLYQIEKEAFARLRLLCDPEME